MRVKNSRGGSIAGTWEKAGRAAVFLCHGLGTSSKGTTSTSVAAALRAAGIASCRFDFTGHGESSGSPADLTLSRALDDLESVYAELLPKKFGVFGSSFGGAVAILFAARHPETGAVFLKSPVRDLRALCEARLGHEGIRRWQREGRITLPDAERPLDLSWDFYSDAGRWDVDRSARAIRAPIEIVHGDADTAVPLEQSRTLPGTLHVLPGVGHRYLEPGAMDRVTVLATDFFRRTLT